MIVRESLFTRPFLVVSVVALLTALSSAMFLHFPRYLSSLGASEVEIGFVFGASSIASVLVRPLIGRTIDAVGRRPVMFIGHALNVTFTVLYLTIDALGPWVYLVRIGHGVAMGTLLTVLFTYGADVIPVSRRTEGLSIFGASGLVAVSLAGVVGDAVLGVSGFATLFLTASCLALAAAIGSIPLRELVVHRESVHHGLLSVLRQRDLVPFWAILVVVQFVVTAYLLFLRTFVDSTGIGTVSGFFGAFATTSILVRLLFARVPARVGAMRVLYPALVILACGLLLIAIANGGAGIVIAGAICGIGHGYAFPILMAIIVDRARTDDRGSALAIFTALVEVAMLIGGPMLGAVVVIAGYSRMFAIASFTLLLSTAAFAIWTRGHSQAHVRA